MKSFTIKKLENQYELESFNYHIDGFHYPIKKNKTGNLKIKEISRFTENDVVKTRLIISENGKDTEIILENEDGKYYSLYINDILPYSFELNMI